MEGFRTMDDLTDCAIQATLPSTRRRVLSPLKVRRRPPDDEVRNLPFSLLEVSQVHHVQVQ